MLNNGISKNSHHQQEYISYDDIPDLSDSIKSLEISDDTSDEGFKGEWHLGVIGNIKVFFGSGKCGQEGGTGEDMESKMSIFLQWEEDI